MPAATPYRFFTTDILIADKIVEINTFLQELMNAYGFQRGGKYKIDSAEAWTPFKEIARYGAVKTFAGGSASNTLRTIHKLGGNLVKSTFVSVLGLEDRDLILQSFNGLDIDLQLIGTPEESETACSLVVKFPDGERTIITYPGNARQILVPEVYKENYVENCDSVFLQGSVMAKLIELVFHNIVSQRWRNTKDFILAAPTSAFQPKYFKYLLASANLFISNTDENGHIMFEPDDSGHLFGPSVAEIRRMLSKSPNNAELNKLLEKAITSSLNELHHLQIKKDLRRPGSELVLSSIGHAPQEAMITDDKSGAYLVTVDGVKAIEPFPDEKITIVNRLGCGDTSFAGLIFARRILQMSPVKSVQFAMVLAAAKLQFDGPVMEDPLGEVKKIAPHIAEDIERRIEAKRKGLILSP